MNSVELCGRRVGAGEPVFIIAEMSSNHGQSLERAKGIISAAAAAGADAIKIQTYMPETLTINSQGPEFCHHKSDLWMGRHLYGLYEDAYLPWNWHEELLTHAQRENIILFSTPFDFTAVDYLESLEMPFYKISSFELVDIPLIRRVGETGKPLILSTGMGSMEEMEEAVKAFKETGNEKLVLMKCNSAYPAPVEDMNLGAIPILQKHFNCPVGLSDHTLADYAAIAGVALGMNALEKHVTLSHADATPDAGFSIDANELKTLVQSIRKVEKACAGHYVGPTDAESESLSFRRSLYVVKDIREGELFTEENIRSIRPACGTPPRYLPEILGRRAARDLAFGTPFCLDMIKPENEL